MPKRPRTSKRALGGRTTPAAGQRLHLRHEQRNDNEPYSFHSGGANFCLPMVFENGHLAFANGRTSRAVRAAEDAKDKKIEQLEAKLHRKNEVMAELMEAHTLLKKELGEI